MDIVTRREAAEALRAIKRGGEGWFSLSEAVIGKPAPRDEVVARLADLIDPGDDVSVSAYDLLPEEDREAIAWMREHGGLDEVKRRWKFLSHYADHVPRSCMERRLARLQRQIDESHAALRRRNQRIAVLASEINRAHNENRMEFLRRAGNYTAFADEVCKRLAPQLRYMEGCTKDVMDAALDALDRRLMPKGYEWPRFEDGEPVRPMDKFADCFGVTHTAEAIGLMSASYILQESDSCTGKLRTIAQRPYGTLIKRPAVLAADGEPIKKDEHVFGNNGGLYRVTSAHDGKVFARHVEGPFGAEVESAGGEGLYRLRADRLTHTKPEQDSWSSVWADVSDGRETPEGMMRRCRALAERGE